MPLTEARTGRWNRLTESSWSSKREMVWDNPKHKNRMAKNGSRVALRKRNSRCWLVRSLTWTGSVCLQLRRPTVPWTASKAVWPEGGGDDCPHLLCSYKASPAALHSGVQCCTCNFTKFFSCRAASILASISYLQYMVKVISSYSLGMLQLQYTEGWSFQILYRYRPVNKTIIYIYKHN